MPSAYVVVEHSDLRSRRVFGRVMVVHWAMAPWIWRRFVSL
jgi:hypothetical protein